MARVLLDSCVPAQLARDLQGHEVETAPRLGWGDLDNGDLLQAMSGRFEVLVTADKSIPQQQVVTKFSIAVVILRAKTNRYPDLVPCVPELLVVLLRARAGDVIQVWAT